jgi:hypothetical protein
MLRRATGGFKLLTLEELEAPVPMQIPSEGLPASIGALFGRGLPA